MQNEILNATGLDGVTDWRSSLAGTLTTDDSLVGRDGVIVLAATKLAAVAGAKVDLETSAVHVTQGERLEIFVHFAAAGGRAALELTIASGSPVGPIIARRQILPLRPSLRTPRRGIPGEFNIAYARFPALATGYARLRVVATAYGGHDLAAYAMRPFLAAGDIPAARQSWAPGLHTNADLALPSWPSWLPSVAGQYQADPLGRRSSFAGDSKVPIYRQVSETTRWIGRGTYALDTRERDLLSQFYEATSGPFYFVRPDTAQLCRAQWTDKEPTDSGTGADRRTEVELLLEVA